MLYPLFALVLMWMTSLAPGRDHGELAWAVTINATSEMEAAVLTAVAFREGSLRVDATGDGKCLRFHYVPQADGDPKLICDEKGPPQSFCTMQIHVSSGGTKALLGAPIACVTKGATMLRESKRIDPKNPIAFYARGPRWKSEEAQSISRDRMWLATKLVRMKPEVVASAQ